jgi:ABC-type microcin C transport system permease subunit YejE
MKRIVVLSAQILTKRNNIQLPWAIINTPLIAAIILILLIITEPLNTNRN